MSQEILFQNPLPVELTTTSEAGAGDYTTETNDVCEITLENQDGLSWVIDGIAWSYSADCTGSLTVSYTNGSFSYDIFKIDITKSGPGFIPIRKKFVENGLVTIQLAAGGSGVVGRLNILSSWLE